MDENNTTVEKTEEQILEEQIVAEVNGVLAKNNYALQPYMVYHETGAFPAVKLRKLADTAPAATTEGDANLDAKIA